MTILKRALKKGRKSPCKFKVVAIGWNRVGFPVIFTNIPCMQDSPDIRSHAENRVMSRYRRVVKTITILRTNKNGDLLPIHPCKGCQARAKRLGIKIVPLVIERSKYGQPTALVAN